MLLDVLVVWMIPVEAGQFPLLLLQWARQLITALWSKTALIKALIFLSFNFERPYLQRFRVNDHFYNFLFTFFPIVYFRFLNVFFFFVFCFLFLPLFWNFNLWSFRFQLAFRIILVFCISFSICLLLLLIIVVNEHGLSTLNVCRELLLVGTPIDFYLFSFLMHLFYHIKVQLKFVLNHAIFVMFYLLNYVVHFCGINCLKVN